MTPEQIAAMIADREAGTPGPWKVKFRKDGSAYMSIGGDRPGDAHSKFSIGLDSQYPSDVTNARRIARVPDMEATIIAQAATPPAAVVEAMELALRHADQVSRDLGWHRIYNETGAALSDLTAWRDAQ